MKNKKGQVLVLFLLLIPIFLVILVMVIEQGRLYIERRRVDLAVQDAISYGLSLDDKTIIKEKITVLLYENINDISSLDIEVKMDYIRVYVEIYQTSIFPLITSEDGYLITSRYVGTSDRIIKRETE